MLENKIREILEVAFLQDADNDQGIVDCLVDGCEDHVECDVRAAGFILQAIKDAGYLSREEISLLLQHPHIPYAKEVVKVNILEPCSNCEEWVEMIDINVPDELLERGFVRMTKCTKCGDQVLHPPVRGSE